MKSAHFSSREALRRLHYDFNTLLQLRHMESGEPFKFIDQAHYEELADAVADYIQEVMVQDYGMERIFLPLEKDVAYLNERLKEAHKVEIDKQVRCPIFLSPNIEDACITLILLCGSGRVASGQWARKLCINDSLKTGSVLPFLDWAKEHSIGVVVLNPNKNVVDTEEGLERIPFNDSSENHMAYTWEAIFKHLPAKHFIMVAHSYGGVNTCKLLKYQGAEALKQLRCVAFTDSVHSRPLVKNLSEEARRFLAEHCINWASSKEPLDTVLEVPGVDCLGDIPPELKYKQLDKTVCVSSEIAEGGAESNSVDSAVSEGPFDSVLEVPGVDCLRNVPPVPPKWKHKQMNKGSVYWFDEGTNTCKVVSAGTAVHEETTMSAFPSICKFLLERLQFAGALSGCSG